MPFSYPRFLTCATIYWNAEGEEKLQVAGWLISAILAKINHLRGLEACPG